jgi:hypothetical protein
MRRKNAPRSHNASQRMNIHDRRERILKNIKNLLNDKSFKNIRDFKSLWFLRVANDIMMHLFIDDENVKRELIKMNRKLKRIENNTQKTNTSIKTYIVASKTNNRKDIAHAHKRIKFWITKKQHKILKKDQKTKTLIIKIRDEEKNASIKITIIKNFLQKMKKIEKKKAMCWR